MLSFLSFLIFLSFPSFPFSLRSAVAVVVANNNNDQSQKRPVSAQCLHCSCWCVISVGGGRPLLIVEFVDDQKVCEREGERFRWAAASLFSFILSRSHPLLLLPNAQPYRHRYILSHYWHTLLQQQQLTVAVVCFFLFLFLLGLFLCCWWASHGSGAQT